MLLWDIWQTLGTPQVAEITALVSLATSVFLVQNSPSTDYLKKHGKVH